MNFDGTYPNTEKESMDKLLEQRTTKPPVRVIVSYPATEEWNGSPPKSNRKQWAFRLLMLIFVLAGIAGGFVWCIGKWDGSTTYTQQVNQRLQDTPNDDQLKKYLIQLVLRHYRRRTFGLDPKDQLLLLLREQSRLSSQSLSTFVLDLDLAGPAVLPQNRDLQQDIADELLSYLVKTKAWLMYLTREEQRLASYEFQRYRQENKWTWRSEDTNWKEEEQVRTLQELQHEYTKTPEVSFANDTIFITGKVLLLKEIVKILDACHTNTTQVTVIASIIYMDFNLTRNIDVAIFAPDWRFITSVILNLRGLDAKNQTVPVKDGCPGASGSPGGLFLAVGDIDISKLTLLIDGGRSSSGHDGPDGRNGTVRKRPNITNKQPRCFLADNTAGLNPAGEVVQRFYVFADEACAEKGGAGGQAGAPGSGGVAIFFIPSGITVQHGKNGAAGENGSNGVDGTSAPGECYFWAYRVLRAGLSAKWDAITDVVCRSDASFALPLISPADDTSGHCKAPFQSKSSATIISRTKAVATFSNWIRRQRVQNKDIKIFNLLEKLEDSSIIANLSTPFDLFDEYQAIFENVTQVDVLASFLKKINRVRESSLDLELKIALQYLEVAVYAHFCTIRFNVGNIYITDINKYLDAILHTVHNLNIDQLTINDENLSQHKHELRNKLSEVKEILIKQSDVTEGPDKRFIAFSSMFIKALYNLIDIADQVVFFGQAEPAKLEALNATISSYVNLKLIYYMGAVSKLPLSLNLNLKNPQDFVAEAFAQNRTATEPILACAEMMVQSDSCDINEITRWENFRKMDQEIITSLQQVRSNDTLLHISEALRTVLRQMRNSFTVTTEGRALVAEVRSVSEDLLIVITQCQHVWEERRLQELLLKLQGMKVKNKKLAPIINNTKHLILFNLLEKQYWKAFTAFQQWTYPLTPIVKHVHQFRGASKQDKIQALHEMKRILPAQHNNIQNDSLIKIAMFTLTSSTGPFYSWRGTEHRLIVAQLLKGRCVTLRASLANSQHALKEAVKLRSVELQLSGIPLSVMRNFAVEMTHSGFSHFLHNSTVFTSVGPRVSLYHNFDENRQEDGPTVFNQAYKRIENGDIILSPFTTWSIQLREENNKANFGNLEKYVNVTNIHLVGCGLYI